MSRSLYLVFQKVEEIGRISLIVNKGIADAVRKNKADMTAGILLIMPHAVQHSRG